MGLWALRPNSPPRGRGRAGGWPLKRALGRRGGRGAARPARTEARPVDLRKAPGQLTTEPTARRWAQTDRVLGLCPWHLVKASQVVSRQESSLRFQTWARPLGLVWASPNHDGDTISTRLGCARRLKTGPDVLSHGVLTATTGEGDAVTPEAPGKTEVWCHTTRKLQGQDLNQLLLT